MIHFLFEDVEESKIDEEMFNSRYIIQWVWIKLREIIMWIKFTWIKFAERALSEWSNLEYSSFSDPQSIRIIFSLIKFQQQKWSIYLTNIYTAIVWDSTFLQ